MNKYQITYTKKGFLGVQISVVSATDVDDAVVVLKKLVGKSIHVVLIIKR